MGKAEMEFGHLHQDLLALCPAGSQSLSSALPVMHRLVYFLSENQRSK